MLASFRTAYLDGAVDYMLGSIRNARLSSIQSECFHTDQPLKIGMTVRTANIPQTVAGGWADFPLGYLIGGLLCQHHFLR